ncbi:hypothetical protein [Mucilaginibacter agri]|uniref:hypothetical protein n=1 Tax=Mucilaginibacter agri TaxID=2695265 RepID=UPI001AA11F0D|nr:hypothetical protein [Mucilaginibacter agri]
MRHPFYTILNVIYQAIICWILIILNAYYNELIIPENLMHSPEKAWLKILIALTEGVTMLMIVYVSNRVALSDTADDLRSKRIVNRTGKIQLIITACFMIAVILN